MTKAERIYISTRVECKNSIKNHGYRVNPDGKAVGYNNLIYDGDKECICTRTVNEIEKLLKRDRSRLESMVKYNTISEEDKTFKTQVYNMIESTISNARKVLESWREI